MYKKQGISLIVLVITIIVMVILAGAVVVTLNNSGIIQKASEAVEETNLATVKDIANLAWAEAYTNGVREQTDLEQAVLDAMDEAKVDMSKYTITVTTNGVEVVLGQVEEVLKHSGIIPEGGTYYVAGGEGMTGDFTGLTGDYTGATAVYTAGDEFPTPTQGDVYVYGDYEYRYNKERDFIGGAAPWYNVELNGWSVVVRDITKTTYGNILLSINNKPIVSMLDTFIECDKLTKAPDIPETVTNLMYAFGGCKALQEAPTIPENVTSIHGMFSICSSLTTLPEGFTIPNTVTDFGHCFYGCTLLTGTIEVNANITDRQYYDMCFTGTTKPITITGSCSTETKSALAATAENGNVTY